MNNISDKEIIIAFKELIEDFKIRVINPGLHFIDNASSKAFKMTITTMEIKYQLFSPSNNREKNVEKTIQIIKNHFIAVLCIVDK